MSTTKLTNFQSIEDCQTLQPRQGTVAVFQAEANPIENQDQLSEGGMLHSIHFDQSEKAKAKRQYVVVSQNKRA